MSFPKIPEIINSLAYDAYTHYLEPVDKSKLEDALEALPDTPASIHTLALKIFEGRWDLLFAECDKEKFPLQALRCLKENQISFIRMRPTN